MAMTIPATGYSYIANIDDVVYLINTSTGVVGAAYGVCTPT